jgi:hypothetical protein
MTKTGIHIGPAIENYGGETFLSQEVTISILQESKNAFKRCHVVCKCILMFGLFCHPCLYHNLPHLCDHGNL